uniref:Uncharacterized protein n=1 Tax=Rhizophora mucronata TaxID=61149 RepID=A0A2P2KBG6_RHIMU
MASSTKKVGATPAMVSFDV